jgi:hypothetical protein
MNKAVVAPTVVEPAAEQTLLSESDRDELDDADRRRLHEALERAEADYQRGDYVDAAVVLEELRGILSGGA